MVYCILILISFYSCQHSCPFVSFVMFWCVNHLKWYALCILPVCIYISKIFERACTYIRTKVIAAFVLYILHMCCPLTDWTLGGPIESDIYWLYMAQIGMYLHFIFATVFVNARKKDYNVLLLHHFLTIALLAWSYAIRYVRNYVCIVYICTCISE